MLIYKQLFMQYMDNEGYRYTDVNDNVVKITFNGDNLKSITVYVSFDKDGEGMIELRCFDIVNMGDKVAAGIIACNSVNAKYRWVKFYVDDDKDIICEADAYVDEATCGEECMNMVRRVVNITDDVYEQFLKAKFS